MTDRAYPQLDPFATLGGSELVAVHQDGRLVRLTLAQLAQWIKTAESIVPAAVPFRGVLLERTTALTGITFPLTVPWQVAAYDTDSFWSAGAPTRITVPNGVTRARLTGACQFTVSGQAGTIASQLRRNGNAINAALEHVVRQGTTGFGNNISHTWTPVINVAPGDFFELFFSRNGLAAVNSVEITRSTFFSLEVVERTP